MNPVYATHGLTNHFKEGERCDRCDRYLENFSTYKGETIVLSVSKSVNHGFICVQCFSDKRNSSRKYYRTEGQIKYFLRGLKS
jgi:uncharacterized radical SAM superfamily Fe-S cluster-containing enzyme